jgi:hypothetical protein
LRTSGIAIFLNSLCEINTNFFCISANLKPNFSNTLVELSFSFQAGGINTLDFIPTSWNISSPARISSSAAAFDLVWKSSS